MVHLGGDHDVGGETRLVGLRAEPEDALVVGHRHRADHHLRRARHDIGVIGGEGLSSLGRQCNVAEGVGVVHQHIGVGVLGEHAGFEAVDVQLGVAYLDRSDDADRVGFAERCTHDAHDVSALV